MLYLILFTVLALGFFAATTMTAQLARNDRVVLESQAAAESGLQFARRQFNLLGLSPDPDPAVAFGQIYTKLRSQLAGSTNMNAHDPNRFTNGQGQDCIYVPGTSGTSASPVYNWMSLGGGAGETRLVITRNGANVDVAAYGRTRAGEPIGRTVQLTYQTVGGAYILPGAGVLSRSPVTLSNGAKISGGDVTVTTTQTAIAPLTMSGGARIDQNFFYTTNTRAPSIINGASVGGQIVPNTPMPAFPTVDGSIFEAFVPPASDPQGPKVITATSTVAATATLTNIRIKANANKTFGNAIQMNGVIFIESPNKISFGGGMRITGIIVTDNNSAVSLSQNQITLDNGVRVDGVETLDPSAFSASERIAELKQLSGALVLAPNYLLTLAGGSRTYSGTLVASKFDISNGYRGTIGGSMICLGDSSFTMVGGGLVTFTGGGTPVAGLVGARKLAVDLGSYLEVAP